MLTVIDVAHQARTELNTERLACAEHRVANADTRSLLVDLNRDLVSIDTNDLCE